MAFMNKIGYLFKEGFKSIFAHGFMSFASVTIITACLLIMGCFSLLAVNVERLIDGLEKENEMLAFVDERLSYDEAKALEEKILHIENISRVEFIDREEAYANFENRYENKKLFESLDSDTLLRHRYVIYLDDIGLMPETQAKLEAVDGVAEVSAQLEISKTFVMVRNVVSAVSVILIAILCLVSVFIMTNTVKLTTFSRREEISIMRMVGGTNSFIRTPFIVEGLVLGLFGAILAFGVQWGVYEVITTKVMTSIAGVAVSVVPFVTLAVPMGLVFLGVGMLVGIFGGSIAIRNYLKV